MADKEYIEREAVLSLKKPFPETHGFITLRRQYFISSEAVERLPAADVRPVVRGRWEWNFNNGYYYCSNCGAVSSREDQDGEYCDTPAFCPNCGADMREAKL